MRPMPPERCLAVETRAESATVLHELEADSQK